MNDISIENRRQQQQLLNNNNLKVTNLLEEITSIILRNYSSNVRIDSLEGKCLNEQNRNWKKLGYARLLSGSFSPNYRMQMVKKRKTVFLYLQLLTAKEKDNLAGQNIRPTPQETRKSLAFASQAIMRTEVME